MACFQSSLHYLKSNSRRPDIAKWISIRMHAPSLKTNSSHLKMDGWNTSLFLGWPIFRCYVSSWEGILSRIQTIIGYRHVKISRMKSGYVPWAHSPTTSQNQMTQRFPTQQRYKKKNHLRILAFIRKHKPNWWVINISYINDTKHESPPHLPHLHMFHRHPKQVLNFMW